MQKIIKVSSNEFKAVVGEIWEQYKLYLERKGDRNAKLLLENIRDGFFNVPKGGGEIKNIFDRADRTRPYKYTLNAFIFDQDSELQTTNVADQLYRSILDFKKDKSAVRSIHEIIYIRLKRELPDTSYKNESDLQIRDKVVGNYILYHYSYNDADHDALDHVETESSICSDLLVIENQSVRIYPIEGKAMHKYLGYPDNPKVINTFRISLQTVLEDDTDKPLVISFYIPNENKPLEMSSGHFTSKDYRQHLIRGTIFLRRIHDQNIDALLSDGEASAKCKELAKSKITPEIVYFFRKKRYNFDRVPDGLFTLRQLNSWKKKEEGKEVARKIEKFKSKNNLFISCPRISLSDDQFHTYKELVNEIIGRNAKLLDKNKEDEIFQPFQSIETYFNRENYKYQARNTTQINTVLSKLDSCGYHLAILTTSNLQTTSVFCEIAMSLLIKRPVLIFCFDSKELPTIIQAADKSNAHSLYVREVGGQKEIIDIFFGTRRDELFQYGYS